MDEKTMNVDPGEMVAAVEGLREQATQAVQKFAEQIELERRLRENPMETLAIAAGAGFILGGGLWPLLRPFVKTALKLATSPQNLVAIAAAAGAIRAAGGGGESADAGGMSADTTAH